METDLSHTFVSTDTPIFVLDLSPQLIKKKFVSLNIVPSAAAERFEPAALSDHKLLNQTLYQLRHEPVMKNIAFVVNLVHNIITIY